jgi:adenylate cyclase class IV
MSETKIPKYTEVECKYRTDITTLPLFKRTSENLPDLESFLYTSGPDTYYVRPDGGLGRYRVAQYPENGKKFAQWTVKCKPEGAKNNIFRFESNWDVSNTPPEEIHAGALAMGFVFNFKIHKTCFIYKFKDATIVMYSVREEGSEKEEWFQEIEVTEETIHELTEDQAWEVISKYEKILEPTGITPQKRMRKSLFELYVKETK